MKIAKRICCFFLVCVVILSFGLSCFGADIKRIERIFVFDVSSETSRSMAFRYSTGDSSESEGNSYAEFSAIKEAEKLVGIECSTSVVNEYCNSMYDHLYMTAAYVSLSVTFSTGETLFVEDVVFCNGDYCAEVEISSTTIGDIAENAVIKDFESNHLVYNRLSKYLIEFDHIEARVEKIVFEPYEG